MLPCQRPFHVITLSFQQYLVPLDYANTLLTQRMIDPTLTLALDKVIHLNPLPPSCLYQVTTSGPLEHPTLHFVSSNIISHRTHVSTIQLYISLSVYIHPKLKNINMK